VVCSLIVAGLLKGTIGVGMPAVALPLLAAGAASPQIAMAATAAPGDKAPIVTSAANPHYQKRFDELHKLAAAGNWAAVRDYKVSGSNSYSKLVARYQQDLLALHAAWEAAQ